MQPREYHRRPKSSIKHCAYPKLWVKRSNPDLRPKRYCRTPSKPDAMSKTECVEQGGSWILRSKKALKRKQGYCRMTAAEKAEEAEEEAKINSAYAPISSRNYELPPAVAGKKVRKSKKARKSSNRPKSRKTCMKRHMSWNAKTHRCNKK